MCCVCCIARQEHSSLGAIRWFTEVVLVCVCSMIVVLWSWVWYYDLTWCTCSCALLSLHTQHTLLCRHTQLMFRSSMECKRRAHWIFFALMFFGKGGPVSALILTCVAPIVLGKRVNRRQHRSPQAFFLRFSECNVPLLMERWPVMVKQGFLSSGGCDAG